MFTLSTMWCSNLVNRVSKVCRFVFTRAKIQHQESSHPNGASRPSVKKNSLLWRGCLHKNKFRLLEIAVAVSSNMPNEGDTRGCGFSVGVVLPAGGSGERMGLSTPKQYCEVGGRLLISYSIEAFHRLPWIHHIVVPVSATCQPLVTSVIDRHNFHKVRTTTGGSTRHRSISSGVTALEHECGFIPDVVIIHDAVRPFVPEEATLGVAMAAKEYGAAGVVRPLVSTVIKVDDDNFLSESLDRSKFWASEMPQAFQYTVIQQAYDRCSDHDLDYGTECLHLAQKYTNCKVKLLKGPTDLWKVTHRKDLFAVEGVLRVQCNKVAIAGFIQSDESSITGVLKQLNFEVVPFHCEEPISNINHVVLQCKEAEWSKLISHTDQVTQMIPGLRTVTVVVNCDIRIKPDIIRRGLNTEKLEMCVWLIVNQSGTNAEELGKFVGDLIWRQNSSLNGQTFYL